MEAVALAVVPPFALALALGLAVSSVLGQALLILDAAPLLELNVDGILRLVARGDVNAHAIPPEPRPQRDEQVAKLLLEGLVEVEVDEGVVDVGAFSEEGREHKAFGSHIPVLFVENKEKGHNCVRRPCNHKAQADAEKHLEEEVSQSVTTLENTEQQKHT